MIKNYPFLKNKNSQFLDKINEYPTVTLVNKIIKNFLQKDYDIIIGFGGGSVLDFAKVLKIIFELNKKVFIKDLIKNIKTFKFKKKLN